MIDECIHGLDRARCDVCSPKPAAQKPVSPAVRRSVRRAAAPAPKRTPGAPVNVDVSTQRLYHLTHVENLAAILDAGGLQTDATPAVDISSPANREARRSTDAAGTTVAACVPFFLSPDAYIWQTIRAGRADPRIVDAVPPAAEFVLLVTTVGSVGGAAAVIAADGDAAAPVTRFATGPDTAARLHRIAKDEDAALRAEVLVPEAVDFDAVTLVGVAHDRARDTVRRILADSAYSPRVAVHPPWFAAPEE